MAIINLSANDIFRTNRLRFDNRIYQKINDFDWCFYARNLSITLRYKFSRGQKFEERRCSNNLEEMNRL